jgi:hypothetical protein
MSKTRPLIVLLLLAAGLAACGQKAATAENTAATGAVVAVETGNTAEITEVKANTVTAIQAAATATPEAVPAKAQVATVAGLPLKHGYYVDSDTPCGQASNATTTLLRREGIGGARDFCEFKKIEQTGPNTYRSLRGFAGQRPVGNQHIHLHPQGGYGLHRQERARLGPQRALLRPIEHAA